MWDVVNEATVSSRSDNPLGRWVNALGPAEAVGRALNWAWESNPGALLVVNDFNVGPEYKALLKDLQRRGRPLRAIGIQSHMHKGPWPIRRVWSVCETYAPLGLPLHFTEVTVLSGRLKTDNDWHTYRTEWPTTPEGEREQAVYVEKLYRTLFSHPAVEAITWWDFADGGWLGAPAGLVRKDLTPKPVYRRLLKMIKSEWWTQVEGRTDHKGAFPFRGFYGMYRVVVQKDGQAVVREITLSKEGVRRFVITLRT